MGNEGLLLLSIRHEDVATQPRNQDGLFEFVNVMWIEWQDGIAYRKAVGPFMRHVWEDYELETIEVTLG